QLGCNVWSSERTRKARKACRGGVGPEFDPGARRKMGNMSEVSLGWNYSNSDGEPEE
ncbi:hypothetical protein A2U01_0066019, partial [Trifolium medium]|nr:hypothetical protein [Trifolium medium]